MLSLSKARQLLKWLIIAVCAIGVLASAITAIQAIGGGLFNYESKVAYKTRSWETQDTVEVKHIAREKGKEAIYTIDTFWAGEVEIPESIYLEYIGEDNNTVTVRIEDLDIYVAAKWIGLSFDKSALRGLSRVSYPWEEAPQKFTDVEIVEVINAIEETVQWWDLASYDTYGQWRETKISFKTGYRRWGVCHTNCLEEGATRYNTPEINWWWNIFI